MNTFRSIVAGAALLPLPAEAQVYRFKTDSVVTVRENFVACDVLSQLQRVMDDPRFLLTGECEPLSLRPPRSVSCVWTRVASRQERKLQMRSLQRKFIGEPLRLQDPLHPSPSNGCGERVRLAETHRQSDISRGRRGLMVVARSDSR